MRFYMGTIWISGRTDLTSVYPMISRRLTIAEIGIVELAPVEDTDKAVR